jgi:hypothetical protein
MGIGTTSWAMKCGGSIAGWYIGSMLCHCILLLAILVKGNLIDIARIAVLDVGVAEPVFDKGEVDTGGEELGGD